MEISDPKAIRALAHPLRLDLMELLATGGPATAARCGRVLGVPQANCSFHLRQLAKYGFVEEAGPGRDRRERQWRVPEVPPTVRVGAGGDRVLKRQLERLVVEREMQAILDHAAREERRPGPPDGGGSGGGGAAGVPGADGPPAAALLAAVAVLSAAEAAELADQWQALLAPYIARAGAAAGRPGPGQHHVRYFMAATPLPDLEARENEHATDD
ncbi:helix-turn-helix domain-containing protein [Kitasatospora sp. NBC_01287]|uniref:winged helix-turn-helix domain-containing protein n=1 Tax=Kitasatospora sp. NBC_01287 TaxID=2903573 RepID=UPI00224F6617|nr:helix-turn-helix domain-containing protein [Kitasatospora sp. NBC_01287]MCX4745686.1 helix-turn-helix domain-containing protein [Kitasatospora sp. NBC_01287]